MEIIIYLLGRYCFSDCNNNKTITTNKQTKQRLNYWWINNFIYFYMLSLIWNDCTIFRHCLSSYSRTHYETLGLQKQASGKEIRAAYIQLCKKVCGSSYIAHVCFLLLHFFFKLRKFFVLILYILRDIYIYICIIYCIVIISRLEFIIYVYINYI